MAGSSGPRAPPRERPRIPRLVSIDDPAPTSPRVERVSRLLLVVVVIAVAVFLVARRRDESRHGPLRLGHGRHGQLVHRARSSTDSSHRLGVDAWRRGRVLILHGEDARGAVFRGGCPAAHCARGGSESDASATPRRTEAPLFPGTGEAGAVHLPKGPNVMMKINENK